MQREGHYASIQGPWLVCSKSKKQHDTMLFAAQAAQVLAASNMMLAFVPGSRYTESIFAAERGSGRRSEPVQMRRIGDGKCVDTSYAQ